MKTKLLALLFAPFLVTFAAAPEATIPAPEIYFSPRGGATEAVVREINAAKTSLSILAYSFTSKPISEAIIAARRRGVKVEVVLDKSQRWEKGEAGALVEAGVPVWFDTKHAIMHDKVTIIDGSVVVTGSFNYTSQAEKLNAENLLVLRSSELAAKYLSAFRELRDAAMAADVAKRTGFADYDPFAPFGDDEQGGTFFTKLPEIAAPSLPTWHEVTRFAGDGSRNTAKFTVGDEWRLRWIAGDNLYLYVKAPGADSSTESFTSKGATQTLARFHRRARRRRQRPIRPHCLLRADHHPMSLDSPWYLSAAATREYLAIAGLRDDDGGPNWHRSERELAEHARVAREVPSGSRAGHLLYRTGRVRTGDRPRTSKLEFTVSLDRRPEGDLPQLVHVRDKGR